VAAEGSLPVRPDDPGRDWTEPGVYAVGPGLYRIPLPIPADGLRAVNVYAVRVDLGRGEQGTLRIAQEPLTEPYLDSLRLVRDLPDRVMLPAHGHPGPSVHARVDELVAHHDARLDQSATAVAAGAHTAFEVAQRLRRTGVDGVRHYGTDG
jgi:hypothetical protein